MKRSAGHRYVDPAIGCAATMHSGSLDHGAFSWCHPSGLKVAGCASPRIEGILTILGVDSFGNKIAAGCSIDEPLTNDTRLFAPGFSGGGIHL